jgi:hypothetical protein
MTMIGTKLFKGKYTNKEYADLAVWCNANNATIEDKGEYYEVVEIPAPSLEELKKAKLQEVDSFIASKITGGFVSLASGEPVTYDSDKDTQLTMQGIALNVQTPLFATEYPNGCPVRGYPIGSDVKQIYMLNAEQVMRWCADLSMHIGTCKQRGWELQAMVNACTTKEELEAIVLE